jgi:putative ABC transport system ATP-binding protein
MVQAMELTKTYTIDNRQVRVVDNVSMAVAPGEFLVVQGSSGSGKTSLLSLLSGLDQPSSGRVFIEGRDITGMSEDDLAPLRNTAFGFVFQSFHLVPALTALENVMFPAELCKDPRAEQKADRLLARVGLKGRCHNFPHQLSGGEMQRVALCRALINAPKIIFADEPTGNLDSVNGQIILRLLAEFKAERGTTLVLVTHNREIALEADRVIALRDGRIISPTDGDRPHVP